jgi:3-hydroxybutyryl-CoA dehydrogenase
MARIEAVDSIDAAASAGLVIEAIVEDINAKRGLFRQLEAIVDQDCVLASNTSSLSLTAIANGLRRPERLLGMHFFNPVPVMKLVEVVSGLQTSSEVADSVYRLAESWGKLPVHARSTPGFIVNRIARPFYAESLALLQEQASTPAVLDACLRGAGFRMGPCELMDLIGHDTNLAVTRSVYAANFYDKRYAPSLLQQELVDGGLLGRKSGRGFYDYDGDATATENQPGDVQPPQVVDQLMVHGDDRIASNIAACLEQHGYPLQRAPDSDWSGLQAGAAQLRLGDGRSATELAGTLDTDIAVFDLPLLAEPGAALAWSPAAQASAQWLEDAPAWLRLFGFEPWRVEDVPGLVVARTIAMLINEAADAVHQGVCDVTAADTAMKLGVNYPAGPFEWLAAWDTASVITLLDRLDAHYRGERYRVSPWLRRAAWHTRKPA